MAEKLHAVRHDLPADKRAELVELLNRNLADVSDLRGQTKHAHWNVKGRDFYQLHKLFDELYAKLDPLVDEIGERITALGGTARGTARQVSANSRVAEFPNETFEGMAVVTALADRYAQVARSTRESIDAADGLGDKDTADLFTEVSREIDQSLYFLDAHLQK